MAIASLVSALALLGTPKALSAATLLLACASSNSARRDKEAESDSLVL
jgi:hypothetical protein